MISSGDEMFAEDCNLLKLQVVDLEDDVNAALAPDVRLEVFDVVSQELLILWRGFSENELS